MAHQELTIDCKKRLLESKDLLADVYRNCKWLSQYYGQNMPEKFDIVIRLFSSDVDNSINDAIDEYDLDDYWYDNPADNVRRFCICTQELTRFHTFVTHKTNGNVLMIGKCCAKNHYIDRPDGGVNEYRSDEGVDIDDDYEYADDDYEPSEDESSDDSTDDEVSDDDSPFSEDELPHKKRHVHQDKKRDHEDTDEEDDVKRFKSEKEHENQQPVEDKQETSNKRSNDGTDSSVVKRRKLRHHDGSLVQHGPSDDPDSPDDMALRELKKRKECDLDEDFEPFDSKRIHTIYIEV